MNRQRLVDRITARRLRYLAVLSLRIQSSNEFEVDKLRCSLIEKWQIATFLLIHTMVRGTFFVGYDHCEIGRR